MLSKIVIGFLDRQRWLDPAGDVLAQVASATFDHLGPLSKPIEDLLHGTPAGHPLHPAFTGVEGSHKVGPRLFSKRGLAALLIALVHRKLAGGQGAVCHYRNHEQKSDA